MQSPLPILLISCLPRLVCNTEVSPDRLPVTDIVPASTAEPTVENTRQKVCKGTDSFCSPDDSGVASDNVHMLLTQNL